MEERFRNNVSKLARNSLWAGIGTYGGLVFIPLTTLITTRALGVEDYGVFSLVQGWGVFITGLCSLGITGANQRLIPIYKGRGEEARIKGSILFTLQAQFILSGIVVSIIVFLPELVVKAALSNEHHLPPSRLNEVIIPAFQFYAISILLTNVYQTFVSSLTGLQAIRYKVFAYDLGGAVAKTLALIMFVGVGFGLYGVLAANIVQDVAIGVLGLFFLLKVFPEMKSGAVAFAVERKENLRFGLALFADSLLFRYTFQMDVLFLGYFGFVPSLGIYTIAQNLMRLVYLPAYAIMSIFGPMCGELYAKNDLVMLGQVYRTATKWSLSVSLPLYIVFTMFASEILGLFGRGFEQGAPILALIGATNVIVATVGLSGAVIISTGRAKLNLINSMIISAITIASFLVLIPWQGLLGAALAYGLSQVIVNIIRVGEVWYLYGCLPFSVRQLKPIVSGAAGIAMVLVAKVLTESITLPYLFFGHMAIFAVTYAGGLWLLKLDDDDKVFIDIFRNKFKRS